MIERPWVTPDEVREYSDNPKVQERSDAKLLIDIARAEQYVETYTHNDFRNEEKYPVLPEAVKAAVIILAEAYARCATSRFITQGVRSETFDDYSYTADDGIVDYDSLGLNGLLDPFVIAGANCGVTLRLRRL